MKLEKFSKKSGKAIARDYLNIVKFIKAFRILMLFGVFSIAYYMGRGIVGTPTVLAYCVIVLCLNFLARRKQMKEYSLLPLVLTEMLDAEKYLELCLELSAKIKNTTGMSALNLANAYFWNGQYENALTILDNAKFKGSKNTEFMLEVQSDAVRLNVLSRMGNFAPCEEIIEKMKSRVAASQGNPRLNHILNDFLVNMESNLAIGKGEYDNYITMEASMYAPPSTLNHISRQYNLAQCYMNLGSTNMAVTYLENTLSKPGNLYIQKQAKEKLHTLKGEK